MQGTRNEMGRGRIIILRGPAGVGKSTVGKVLKKTLGDSLLFNIDRICSEMIGDHQKKSSVRYASYELCFLAAKKNPKKNLIFERLFNKQEDIDKIKKIFSKLKYKVHIITLNASLQKLIKQDSKRPGTLGVENIKRLYKAFEESNVKNHGYIIEVKNKSPKKVVEEIILKIDR